MIIRERKQQMFAYAMKYDCPRVILLYPKTSEKDVLVNNFDFGLGKTLQTTTVDICRDLKAGKEELKKELTGILGLPNENKKV